MRVSLNCTLTGLLNCFKAESRKSIHLSVMPTLCKLDKKRKSSSKKAMIFAEACIQDPKFVCQKCFRAANCKKFLCKATPAFRKTG